MSEEEQSQPLRGEVMDVAGVAEYLGFSPSTIYEKVQTKDIPHVRIGNSLRSSREALHSSHARRRKPSASSRPL